MAVSSLRRVELPAPGKLNGFLHVTGRRADGYHTLETLFVPISHGDVVTLAERDDGAIVRERGAMGVAPEDDLALRAARLMQAESSVERGVAISVEKKLPLGGGLGGGSSDAATVLLGLNRLWRLNYSRRALMTIALKLGADVPFFVFGEPALGRGIGELLTAVSLPPMWFVVIDPGVAVPTPTIFAASELTRHTASTKILVFPEGFGRNDLQAVAAARFPVIEACLETLAREAATVRATAEARMSGSGSCVFAAFAAEELAAQVLSRATRTHRVTGFVARALDRHPLWGLAAP
jgi:4-diphosphocytidyl-2-C-methyl-D-erythritol kinase